MKPETLPPEAEGYLRELRLGLASLPLEDREEIVAEIRSHLCERQRRGAGALLDGFEAPQDYAAHFISERTLRKAIAQGTSLRLGMALLTDRAAGLAMILLVVPLVLVQVLGAALALCGALKVFLPARVGLFLDSTGRFVALGALGGDLSGLREVLGFWAVPLFLGVGVGLFWAGNRALKLVAARRLRSMRNRQAP